MRIDKFALLLSILLISSCGGKFSEDYWSSSSTSGNTNEEVNKDISFKATITSFDPEIANINGVVEINITAKEVVTVTNLTELPQSLMIAQRSITNQTCDAIATQFPLGPITNNTLQLKSYNFEDRGTREALISDLNLDDTANGDSVNLKGKSFVIRAYTENLNSPAPQAAAISPVACGTLEVITDSTNGSTTGGTTTEGTAGGIGGI